MSELGRPFLSPDLRQLIEGQRQVADPPDRMKRAVAERVDRSLGLGGAMLAAAPGLGLDLPLVRDSSPPPLSPPPLSPPPLSPTASFFGWKAAGAAMAAVIAGAAALVSATRAPMPIAAPRGGDRMTVVHERPAAAEVEGASALVVPESDAPPVFETAVAHPKARRHKAAFQSALVDTLSAERTVLDVARAALVRRDAAGALAAVRSHERAFPRGQLREERDSMRIQALALAHDTVALHAARDKFLRHFPRSMFLPAVEQALEPSP